MKKRSILYILVLSLLLAVFPLTAAATEVSEETPEGIREPNQCGEDIYWSYEEGVLTLTGTGEMDDFYEYTPWEAYRDEITTVILDDGITYVGAHAFTDFDQLTEVDFGEAMYEIGTEAFLDCDGLTVIELPESFKVFGEESFRNCKNLSEIHCAGRFPTFRQNCLWDTYVTIYFPADKPWGVEYIAQLEEAFKGRVEFLASDGSDPYDPNASEETEPEETSESTEETTEETTAPTEQPTQGTTAPVTEISEPTEGTTAPETEPQQTTQPQPEKENSSKGGWIGFAIVLGTAVLLVLGFVIFAPKGKGGKYRAR